MDDFDSDPDYPGSNAEVPSPLFYGDNPAFDPSFRGDFDPFGSEDPAHTAVLLEKIVKNAIDNGLPLEYHAELRSLVFDHAKIFRTRLGSDPPIDSPPMQIKLQDCSRPVRVKLRRYSPPQAAFLRSKVDELLRLGIIRRNNESQWACAPLVVPKAGSEGFRFTVDLRPVNSQTIPYTWPMPDLESATAELSGDSVNAVIDLCQGYYQLALHEDSQECQSFITPDGVFTPTRVMQGQTNAVFFFQSTIQSLCLTILDLILQWLDDLLFHAKTPRMLLDALKKIFSICLRVDIKLHAEK